MSRYVDGFVLPVRRNQLEKYEKIAQEIFFRRGAALLFY